jgi:nitronate monooxygenase
MFALPCPLPIIQAPMAGGTSTPALAAAVANAGGFGFVAGGYLSADALRAELDATHALTDAALGVNVFVPSAPSDPAPIAAYAERLRAERPGTPLGEARWEDDAYAAKLDLLVAAPEYLVSFTFGCPSAADVDRLHGVGTAVALTVTDADQARQADAVGADALIVQGTEAGGHQGGFDLERPNHTPLLDALALVRAVASLPVIAAGGVMTGSDLRAVLDAGAVAAQLGTAWLCTPEAGTSAVHRDALLGRRFDGTVITRAYSGRYGRGLANRFAREHADAPSGYPELHHLTRPLRAAAVAAADAQLPNLWAGTGWRHISPEPAANIVQRIAADADH